MKWSVNLLFTLLALNVNAQDSFVTFLDNDESKLGIYDIIYDEEIDCYFTLGNKIDSLNGLWIAKFNKCGILIDENFFYGDTLYNFQLEQKNKLIKIENGVYFTSGILAFSQSQQYRLFFDRNLDIISYKETSPFVEGLTKFNFSSLKYNDDIILAGTKQKNNFEIDTYVKRISQDGEEIWETEIGKENDLNDRYTSVIVFDTLIIVGTTTRILGSSTTAKSQCHISFIDAEDGGIMHEFDLNLPQSSNSGPTDVIPFERGGQNLLAFGSRKGTYNEEYFEFRSQIRYFITDLTGNVIDSISLGNNLIPSNGLFFNNRINNGFISSGIMLIDDESAVLPFIGKFNEFSDPIWWSHYGINDLPSTFDRYEVTGQIILPDESIVLCGNLEHVLPGTNTKIDRPFIMKLDSEGCFEPGCRESVNNNSIINLEKTSFIAPNPSKGSFSIPGNSEEVQLFDTNGNKVPVIIHRQGVNTIIEVPNFRSGVHYIIYMLNDFNVKNKVVLIN